MTNEGFIVVVDLISAGAFEQSIWMRGWDDFLCDLYIQPALAEKLMDKITNGLISFFDALFNEIGDEADIVCCGDDLGMQDRSIIPRHLYDQYVCKYHKKLFTFIKSRTKAKILLHSCGSVYELIPGLIEAGVDILNPIQVAASNMEPERLKKEFGPELIFWGGIDSQHTLPFGTLEQIKDHIKRLVDILGKDGGYVLAPGHNIQNHVAPERIHTMLEAMREYR